MTNHRQFLVYFVDILGTDYNKYKHKKHATHYVDKQ